MRIALLSALADRNEAGGASVGERLAFRRFAGKSVLAHQIDCAAQLACTRALCLASGMGPDLSLAKAYAERSGLRFDAVDSLPRLASQVTSDDEVVVIADGVLPDRAAVVDALNARPGVLAFPSEPAIELGFERIDADRAWSGVLRTRGESVARLMDLPEDCDLSSSLLRIALQQGGRVIEADPKLLVEGTWQRRIENRPSVDVEWRWITRQVQPAPFSAPGRALADRIGLRLAHGASGGRWASAPHLSAILCAVLTLFALLADWPLAGLVALFGVYCALAVARMFDSVQALGAVPKNESRLLKTGEWLGDGLLWALLARFIFTVPSWLSLLLPVLLIAVLYLGAAQAPPSWRGTFKDRILLLAALVPVASGGFATSAIAALTALGLAALLWNARLSSTEQITAD